MSNATFFAWPQQRIVDEVVNRRNSSDANPSSEQPVTMEVEDVYPLHPDNNPLTAPAAPVRAAAAPVGTASMSSAWSLLFLRSYALHLECVDRAVVHDDDNQASPRSTAPSTPDCRADPRPAATPTKKKQLRLGDIATNLAKDLFPVVGHVAPCTPDGRAEPFPALKSTKPMEIDDEYPTFQDGANAMTAPAPAPVTTAPVPTAPSLLESLTLLRSQSVRLERIVRYRVLGRAVIENDDNQPPRSVAPSTPDGRAQPRPAATPTKSKPLRSALSARFRLGDIAANLEDRFPVLRPVDTPSTPHFRVVAPPAVTPSKRKALRSAFSARCRLGDVAANLFQDRFPVVRSLADLLSNVRRPLHQRTLPPRLWSLDATARHRGRLHPGGRRFTRCSEVFARYFVRYPGLRRQPRHQTKEQRRRFLLPIFESQQQPAKLRRRQSI